MEVKNNMQDKNNHLEKVSGGTLQPPGKKQQQQQQRAQQHHFDNNVEGNEGSDSGPEFILIGGDE